MLDAQSINTEDTDSFCRLDWDGNHKWTSVAGALTLNSHIEGSLLRRLNHTARWCKTFHSSFEFSHFEFESEVTEDYSPRTLQVYSFKFELHTNGNLCLIIRKSDRNSIFDSVGNFFHTIIESMNDAVVVTNAPDLSEGGPKIIFANELFANMSGYGQTELVGYSPKVLQGEETSYASNRRVRQALETWKPIVEQVTNYRKDGSTFYVELNITPVKDKTGWYSHWVSVQRDISARLVYLEQIRQRDMVMDSTLVGCWSYDLAKDLLRMDSKVAKMHGFAEQKIVKIEHWLTTIHEADRQDVRFKFIRAITAEADLNVEYQINKDKNEELSWIRCKATRLSEITGVELHLSGICFDVSKEKRNAIELEKHRQISQQNAKLASLGELAAGVGHEINNPLSVITSITDLIGLKKSQGFQEETFSASNLEQLKEAANRIERIVDGLRGVSSLARKNEELRPIDIVGASHNTLRMLTELFSKEGIEVDQIKPEQGEHCIIMADAAGLQQILINLMNNARDALATTDAKSITVRFEQTKVKCTLIVEDTGEGMSLDVQERIFEPFMTTKSVGKGTGLGLAITKTVVESFGGQISCKSILGSGTSFQCDFPRFIGKAGEETESSTAPPLQNKHVLLVDDDAAVGQSLTALLSAMGCKITTAVNGAEAMVKMNEASFDLILTDLKMPVLGGVELLEMLNNNENWRAIPKYVITGDVISYSDDAIRVISQYTRGIINKPIRINDIVPILEQC